MHDRSLRSLVFFTFLATATSLAAQAAPIQQTEPCPVNPPKQLSFSAEIKVYNVQTLADGTTITRDGKGIVARDSQNRTLNVTTSLPFASEISEDNATTFATVEDPVAGTETQWDSRSRKATVRKMPSELHGCWTNGAGGTWYFGPRTPPVSTARSSSTSASIRSLGVMNRSGASTPPQTASAALRAMRPDVSQQDLGTAVILGVEAHGTRTLITTPVGAVGNDKPLVRSTETWTASGLITPLRHITTDPRTGTETREVIRLDLTEPPLSTFQPPEGYEIQLEELHEVPCQE